MILWFVLFCPLVLADIYFHNPRGSNNRLNERSATRNNNNRLFDSQNNNRGGYNAADRLATPATSEDEQFQMKYFQSLKSGASSELVLSWTNQHGCGGNDLTNPHKQNCNFVIQYMCSPELRNGISTSTPKFTAPVLNNPSKDRESVDVITDEGLHESWAYYDACYRREAADGLYLIDQKLGSNSLRYSSAIHTRQNRKGVRYGYECPEERDYYPYWHPSPWIDIAVLTDNVTRCQWYKENSFNRRPKNVCVMDSDRAYGGRYNNKHDCLKNNGKWITVHSYVGTVDKTESECISSREHVWGIPFDSTDLEKQCLIPPEEVVCEQAQWTRSNHLGDPRGDRSGGTHYTWKIPHFTNEKQCVLRIRYNISTDDYNGFSSLPSIKSYISETNPDVQVSPDLSLPLALNTAQTGRVFEDRSHTFILAPRPDSFPKVHLHNINVMGKRGNIVQVYPAVQYDFTPTHLTISSNEMLHFQWAGANTHHNQAPGGDGATGADGQGTVGTDRNNLLLLTQNNHASNFPAPFEEVADQWSDFGVVWSAKSNVDSINSAALSFASSGYYPCEQCDHLDPTLEKAPASFSGIILRARNIAKNYSFVCTRNNDFSNRSQKFLLIVN